MRTRTISVEITVPVITDELRSSAMAISGAVVIGAICLLAALRASADPSAYPTPGAAAVATLAAASIFLGVIRWVPSLSDEIARPVPRRHATILLTVTAALGLLAIADIGANPEIFGLLTSLCLLNAYLACWGYRALFLIRRIVLFSVLTWPPIAAGLYSAVNSLLTGVSDLTYQRLGSLGVGDASAHPWRVLSAMSNHATIAVTGAVTITLAASRLRLSLPAMLRLTIAAAAAMILHHVLLLSAAIESYQPSPWDRFATSPMIELAVAVDVAAAMFYSVWNLTASDGETVAAAERDPAIFGSHNVASPRLTVRFCSVLFPALLLTAAVIRR